MNIQKIYERTFFALRRRKYLLYNFWFKKRVPLRILNSEKTIKKVIEDKQAVCRFGDGELRMIDQGYTIGFQKYNEKLSKRLDEVLNSCDPNILICIPYTIYDTSHMKQKAASFWEELFFYERKHVLKLFHNKKNRRKQVYGDSLFTRLYMDYNDKQYSKRLFEALRKLWDNKEIVIVEGEKSRLGVGNDLFSNAKMVKRIVAPAENAFDVYDKILFCCQKYCKERLTLIALGPTATVLAYDLGKMGIQAIDIGHIDVEYEWFIRGCDKKCAIEGKYVNEALNGRDVIGGENDIYREDIIEIIG